MASTHDPISTASVRGASNAEKNVYSAQPAFPFLATSVLSHRGHQQDDDQPPGPTTSTERESESIKNLPNPTTWNLRNDLHISLSRANILRCGTVIGLSYLREWNYPQLRQEQCREQLGQVPRRLLASLLLDSKCHRGSVKAFIIHPTNSSTFAPETLLHSILSLDRERHGNTEEGLLFRDEAISLLDNVHLLGVYDFPGAVQAISQVSDALHGLRPRREQRQAQTSPERVLLIVESLDALTESVIRTSNPLRGSALLMPVLRTLTHLSRTYADLLATVLVNTTGLSGASAASSSLKGKDAGASASARHVYPPSQVHTSAPSVNMSDDGGLHSIFFHSPSGIGIESVPGSLLPTLLSRTMDQGTDTHLLLSMVRGRFVVEVIKDRVGDGVGKWSVWE